MKDKTNKAVILAIVFAALLISGSLIFLGTQMGGGGVSSGSLEGEIQKGIDSYIQKQQAEAAKAQAKANKPRIVEGDFSDDDPFMGDKNAPVTIVEFSDYECPFCKRFYDNTLPQLKEKYIDTGKVKFVYRDFPLNFHKGARPAAIAAECAREQGGDETYFKFHDLIFENQGSLNNDTLKQHADTLGLNTSEFNDCFDSQKYADEVDKDFADGKMAGVTGTPGFLINGQLVSGAQPFSVFEAIIENALKQ